MTALAEAELEYPDGHTSRAAYVTFPLCDPPPAAAAAAAAPLQQVSDRVPLPIVSGSSSPQRSANRILVGVTSFRRGS